MLPKAEVGEQILPLPVQEVSSDHQVLANHGYVIPPDALLSQVQLKVEGRPAFPKTREGAPSYLAYFSSFHHESGRESVTQVVPAKP